MCNMLCFLNFQLCANLMTEKEGSPLSLTASRKKTFAEFFKKTREPNH